MTEKKKWIPIITGAVLTLIAGGLSALFTASSMDIYPTLNQPPLAPPGILFPIVWSILYALTGGAAGLVYSRAGSFHNTALRLYLLQLFFNVLWPVWFFNLQWFGFAFLWLMALWVLIIFATLAFFKIVPLAGWLMIPYLIWVTFAAYLNLGIWWLN